MFCVHIKAKYMFAYCKGILEMSNINIALIGSRNCLLLNCALVCKLKLMLQEDIKGCPAVIKRHQRAASLKSLSFMAGASWRCQFILGNKDKTPSKLSCLWFLSSVQEDRHLGLESFAVTNTGHQASLISVALSMEAAVMVSPDGHIWETEK